MQRWTSFVKRWCKRLGLLLLLMAASFLLMDQLAPLPNPYAEDHFSTVVVAADGTPLRAFADDNGVWRYSVSLDEVSPLYIEALLNYEDRHFFDHPGINPKSLIRAAWQAVKNRRIVSGGSTITMQVARIIDPHERSISGKIKQMFRALQLEMRYSKREILEIYLNKAPFGGTIEGVQAASFAYLGKPVLELSHGDAALLAVLPQSPTRFRPDRNPERAEKARNKVLNRMATFAVWPELTVDEAKQERVYSRRFEQPMLAPLLARRVQQEHQRQLATQNQEALTHHAGMVRTTLDAELQQALEMEFLNRVSIMPDGVSAAALVVKNSDMSVQAYLGSADFDNDSRLGHVDMVTAKRSPGSTLKPFVYGMAIEQGLIHSASLMVDAPQSFYNYRPANFDKGFMGPVSVQEALQRSLNLPAVDMMDRIGSRQFSARMAAGGVDLSFPQTGRPNLTVILGGVATNLESLVGGYAALARDGLAATPRLIANQPLEERRLLSSGAAWITREMLRDQARPGAARHAAFMNNARKVAWKTGTSYGHRDAWAVGVVDDYTVGVWVGRPNGTPTPGQFGAKTALPILFSIVDGLPRRQQMPQPQPRTVAKTEVCWPIGQAEADTPSELCHNKLSAWTLNDMVPKTLPDRAISARGSLMPNPQVVSVASDTQQKMPPACQLMMADVPTIEQRAIARWPQALRPWLTPREHRLTRVPKLDDRCLRHTQEITAATQGVQIRYPADGAEIRSLPNEATLPSINLTARGDGGRLYWIVNGETVGQTTADQVQVYRFEKMGEHVISVMDGSGFYDSVTVTVE